MNLKRVEQLLREYARLRPPERLFSHQSEQKVKARRVNPQVLLSRASRLWPRRVRVGGTD